MTKAARRRLLVLGTQLAILVLVLGGWEAGTRVMVSEDQFLLDPFFFSRPSKIAARVVEWLQDGTIERNVAITLYESLGAFVTGVAGGVVVGFLLGRSDFWARVFNPYVQVINALPRLIFAPILLLLFGLGANSKIALGFSLVFFIVFFNAFNGVRDVDRNVLNNARMLGANEGQLTRHVLLPSAMSWILASLHTSVGFALVGAVVGEYLGASRGIGYVISHAEGNLDATGVWSGMAVLCVFVILVELAVTRVETRLVRWKPQQAAEPAA